MKITIELNEAEVKGIKAYLKATDDNPRPSKHDVSIFINSYIGAIHSPREAVSDYIRTASLDNQKNNQ